MVKILDAGRAWSSHREFQGQYVLYYHNAGGYWIKTFDFRPHYRSLVQTDKKHTTISELSMPTQRMASLYLAILNSSLFYFFWKSMTDARHVYPSDIAMFPIALPVESAIMDELEVLITGLMTCMVQNSERIIYGKAEVEQFRVAPCKPILDEIDRVLARHYGFTAEELDFILNYDIKYRMGDALGGEDE